VKREPLPRASPREPGAIIFSIGMHASPVLEALVGRLQTAPALVLLLDYDGTLVPFAPTPEEAAPDDELIALLRGLAARPHTEVHVVSGRTRETLEGWLGFLRIGLHAEHGLASRAPGAATWQTTSLPPQGWRPGVLALMRAYAARTPGARVEEKSAGAAWHYRLASPALGKARARALERELGVMLGDAPVKILPGAKVVEVLVRGIHKGRLVPSVAMRARDGALLVAIGDDRTDEDMFAALPRGALAVHVGPEATCAAVRLSGVRDVRALIHALAATRPS
jgi:trehalose 6-phosphate synthase/phosphatase